MKATRSPVEQRGKSRRTVKDPARPNQCSMDRLFLRLNKSMRLSIGLRLLDIISLCIWEVRYADDIILWSGRLNTLSGELAHLLLTPFPSGHTLGGTLFKIRSPTSGTVVYATGINHTGERHLDGMVGGQGGAMGYDEGLIRPDLLIVEAGRATVTNPKRREREKAVIGESALPPSRAALTLTIRRCRDEYATTIKERPHPHRPFTQTARAARPARPTLDVQTLRSTEEESRGSMAVPSVPGQ